MSEKCLIFSTDLGEHVAEVRVIVSDNLKLKKKLRTTTKTESGMLARKFLASWRVFSQQVS